MPGWDIGKGEYIHYRVIDPDKFEGELKTIQIKKKPLIKATLGKLKGKDTTTVQSYLFFKEDWELEDAKQWVKDNVTNKKYMLRNKFSEFVSFKMEEPEEVEDEQSEEEQDLMIQGLASTSGTDRSWESVLPLVWNQEVIDKFMKNAVLMYFHDYTQPAIGRVELINIIENVGIEIKALVVKERPNVIRDIKAGLIKGFSIGFRVLDWIYNEASEEFCIKALELLEVSVCAIPCNEDTLFEVVKSFKGEVSSLNIDVNEENIKENIREEENMDEKLKKELEELKAYKAKIEEEKAIAKRQKEMDDAVAAAVNKVKTEQEEAMKALQEKLELEKEKSISELKEESEKSSEQIKIELTEKLEKEKTMREELEKKMQEDSETIKMPGIESKRQSSGGKQVTSSRNRLMLEEIRKNFETDKKKKFEVKTLDGNPFIRTKDVQTAGTAGSGTGGDVYEDPELEDIIRVDTAYMPSLPFNILIPHIPLNSNETKVRRITDIHKARAVGETFTYSAQSNTNEEVSYKLKNMKVDGGVTDFLTDTAGNDPLADEIISMQDALQRLTEYECVYGDEDAFNEDDTAAAANYEFDGIDTVITSGGTDLYYDLAGTALELKYLSDATGRFHSNLKGKALFNAIMMSPRMWAKVNQLHEAAFKTTPQFIMLGGTQVPTYQGKLIHISSALKSSTAAPTVVVTSPVVANATVPAGDYQFRVSGIDMDGETAGSTVASITVTAGDDLLFTFAASALYTKYRIYMSDTDGVAGTERLLGTYLNHDLDGSSATTVRFHLTGDIRTYASTLPKALDANSEPIYFVVGDRKEGTSLRVNKALTFKELGYDGDGRRRIQMISRKLAITAWDHTVFRLTADITIS